jgi:hypothetical protein
MQVGITRIKPAWLTDLEPFVLPDPAPSSAPPTDAFEAWPGTVFQPAATSPGRIGPDSDFRWMSQLTPDGHDKIEYENGAANCGPTSMAMIARARRWRDDLTDAQLIETLMTVAETTPLGTSPMGIIWMAREIGAVVQESEMSFPGFDEAFYKKQLGLKKPIIAMGAFVDKTGNEAGDAQEPVLTDHIVTVYGYLEETGKYQVLDPFRPEVTEMTSDELRTFLEKNSLTAGLSVAIG